MYWFSPHLSTLYGHLKMAVACSKDDKITLPAANAATAFTAVAPKGPLRKYAHERTPLRRGRLSVE